MTARSALLLETRVGGAVVLGQRCVVEMLVF